MCVREYNNIYNVLLTWLGCGVFGTTPCVTDDLCGVTGADTVPFLLILPNPCCCWEVLASTSVSMEAAPFMLDVPAGALSVPVPGCVM